MRAHASEGGVAPAMRARQRPAAGGERKAHCGRKNPLSRQGSAAHAVARQKGRQGGGAS